MRRFQLPIRRGEDDESELGLDDQDGEPHTDRRVIVGGEVYVIRGATWL